MRATGANVWYFPDGFLPQKSGEGSLEAHEALMLLNPNMSQANIILDFYFENRPPIKGISITVGAERVRALRLDHASDIGNVQIPPLTQYAICVRSDTGIIAQFGRLDTTQANLAYYTTMGYCAEERGIEKKDGPDVIDV
jgi:hypothetical protein